MRDATRQLADSLHLVRLTQLVFRHPSLSNFPFQSSICSSQLPGSINQIKLQLQADCEAATRFICCQRYCRRENHHHVAMYRPAVKEESTGQWQGCGKDVRYERRQIERKRYQ